MWTETYVYLEKSYICEITLVLNSCVKWNVYMSKRVVWIWKRDVCMWKETYTCENVKRKVHCKRHLHMLKETERVCMQGSLVLNSYVSNTTCICGKESCVSAKKTFVCERSVYTKRDVSIWKETLTFENVERDVHVRKTRIYVKRELKRRNERILGIGFIRVNGNVCMWKRDVCAGKKRRIYVEKEV